MVNKFRFDAKLKKFEAKKLEIMKAIANNSSNFFKVTNFEAQGFVDTTVSRWAPTKKNKGDTKILVDTGAGRQSIHVYKVTNELAVIQAEAEYMRYQNDGTGRLPQRKFMGNSAVLAEQNQKIIRAKMKGVI